MRKITAKQRQAGFRRLVLKWRARRKLSQAAAARELGVPARTYQDWEYGKRAPRGLALALIAQRLINN